MLLFSLSNIAFAQSILIDRNAAPGVLDLTSTRTVVEIATSDRALDLSDFVLATPVDDVPLDEVMTEVLLVDPLADAHLLAWDFATDEFIVDGVETAKERQVRIRCARIWRTGVWCRIDEEGRPSILTHRWW